MFDDTGTNRIPQNRRPAPAGGFLKRAEWLTALSGLGPDPAECGLMFDPFSDGPQKTGEPGESKLTIVMSWESQNHQSQVVSCRVKRAKKTPMAAHGRMRSP